MFVPRLGRQFIHLGIRQHSFRSHFCLESTRQTSFRREIQNSAISRGIWQGTKKSACAIRVLGVSATAIVGLGVSAFTSPKVLCEGLYSVLISAGGEFT